MLNIAGELFHAASAEFVGAVNILDFEVVQISTYSQDYLHWNLQRQKQKNAGDGVYDRKILDMLEKRAGQVEFSGKHCLNATGLKDVN